MYCAPLTGPVEPVYEPALNCHDMLTLPPASVSTPLEGEGWALERKRLGGIGSLWIAPGNYKAAKEA
eukprot:scaffold17_cov124-Isochrysis_galbana.AAC.3